MQNSRLNMQNGSKTNPVSLRFALKQKKKFEGKPGILPWSVLWCQKDISQGNEVGEYSVSAGEG